MGMDVCVGVVCCVLWCACCCVACGFTLLRCLIYIYSPALVGAPVGGRVLEWVLVGSRVARVGGVVGADGVREGLSSGVTAGLM